MCPHQPAHESVGQKVPSDQVPQVHLHHLHPKLPRPEPAHHLRLFGGWDEGSVHRPAGLWWHEPQSWRWELFCFLFNVTASGRFTNEILSRLFHVRAGVEVIRERSGEDRPGGKPQETDWRQADVINQVFYSHQKRQWFRGWGGRLKKKKNQCRKSNLSNGLRSRGVMATQSCSGTLGWREWDPRPWCWITHLLDVSAVKGKAGITLNWTLTNTRLKFETLFLLLRDYCVTKCTRTFQSIKLNSSSHLCQNSLSIFFLLLFLKCFEKSRVSLMKRHFPPCFECVLDAEPSVCVCVVGVSARADLCWENHMRGSRKTHSFTQFDLEFTGW